MLRKLKRAVRSFEQKFEKRGYRSPLKKHRSLSQKVSLIVPTYNVEPYIGEFLASITSQSTGLRNLEVIIVDDGSTDRTGEIAKAWVAKYPRTIRYIHQENKGAAEARNTGLAHASGEWVSFPDPDDLLPRKWLAAFDRELRRQHSRPILIVTMPIHVFREKTGRVRNNHPLASFYRKRVEAPTNDLGNYFLLSSAKTFFRREAIERHSLRFDSRVRPSFEDGHFVNRLIAACPGYSAVRLSRPAYIYRKREAGTSQLDQAKLNPDWLTTQLRTGYLDLIDQTKDEDGVVPHFAQRSILYSLAWRFGYLLNHSDRIAHLSERQRDEFTTLLSQIFNHIDSKTIRSMNVGALSSEERKVGILAMFKDQAPANDVVELVAHDPLTQQLQFACWTSGESDPDVCVFVDYTATPFAHPSRSEVTFLDQPFVTQHRFWVDAPNDAQISATIGGRPALIKSGGKILIPNTLVRDAISAIRPAVPSVGRLPRNAQLLREYATSPSAHSRFANCWILMDREDFADDNAEHLYRYLMRNGSAQKSFFVLGRSSPDWDRLSKEGFKLLAFGSDDHIAAVINADILISSHLGRVILWPAEKGWIQDLVSYQFVLLGHGVRLNDMSSWFNPQPIRLLTTSAVEEWNSIASPNSNYFLSARETKLTGLPRSDALLEHLERTSDIILIMPTWRPYHVGEQIAGGMAREPLADFMQTNYARAWKGLLESNRLRSLAELHEKTIVFCPHPNMAMYLEDFELPNYIRFRDPRLPPSIQETFAETALLVTDYSSVAFDCAYIRRPVAYYQFDRSEYFAIDHVYSRGYFDFYDHGFGPVAETQEQVLDAIEKALRSAEDPVYAERRERFFAFRDGRCCERVYNAILELLPKEAAVEQAKRIAAE